MYIKSSYVTVAKVHMNRQDVAIYNYNLKKEVGIAMNSKETSYQLRPVIRSISFIGYCYNAKPNACINKAFSSTLQNLILTVTSQSS